jgi:hypothetical protein
MKTRNCNWFNTETKKQQFGIDVFHNGKWMHCSDNNGLLLFDSEEERDEKRKELRSKEIPVAPNAKLTRAHEDAERNSDA